MSAENNIATEKVEANWDALTSSQEFGEPSEKKEPVINTDEAVNKDVVETPEQIAEKEAAAKTESDNKLVEEKAKADLATEAKELGLSESATKEEIEAAKTAKADELSLDEEKDAPAVYPPNSLRDIAQKLGVEIKDETPDAFKEVFITKEEAAKQAQISKEELFAQLKPETAAALELIELGVPDHLINNPTKEIDEYLRLDNAELLRAELSTYPNWTEDMVNKEIEDQIESGKIDHSTAKIRAELTTQKQALELQQTDILQKYREQNAQASQRQKELERTETIKALNNVSEIAGVKIPQKIKDNLIIKYNNGLYDKELSTAQSNAEYIVKKELEAAAIKQVLNKALEKVKSEATNKLLNIPPVKPNGGGTQIANEQHDNWSQLDKDFA
jgi:hypothetical protein